MFNYYMFGCLLCVCVGDDDAWSWGVKEWGVRSLRVKGLVIRSNILDVRSRKWGGGVEVGVKDS